VLITAIALAILYFALMELMLIDSSRALREAQRFRSKVVATTLAESAAELSAASMVTNLKYNKIKADDEQGSMNAECKVNSTANASETAFEITAEATTSGVSPVTSRVSVQGRIVGQQVKVDYTYHSQ
jgi:CRISPR/Cas system-associated exonuclease Cas4 (RecB family)